RNLFADIAAAGGQRAQLVDLCVKLGDGLFKIQVTAHVIRHSGTIGRKRGADEVFSDKREERSPIQAFSASRRSRRRSTRAIGLFHGEAHSKSRRGERGHLSASGCRSRT